MPSFLLGLKEQGRPIMRNRASCTIIRYHQEEQEEEQKKKHQQRREEYHKKHSIDLYMLLFLSLSRKGLVSFN